MSYKVHPTSDVQTNHIGENTTIWQFCVIFKEAVIGANCNICAHCLIENRVVIGDNVTVKSGVQLWNGVQLENEVFVGPNVSFTNDTFPRSKNTHWDELTTIVGKGASIGANSTILCGIELGTYCMIGAGSVVTKSIPPFTLWYGNPAVHRGYVTEQGQVLGLDLKDKVTEKQYILVQGKPECHD
jgi:acetyltransferase-like isoleucine patch superfamily enzyme